MIHDFTLKGKLTIMTSRCQDIPYELDFACLSTATHLSPWLPMAAIVSLLIHI